MEKDRNMKDRSNASVQDTGNPVFDATVNIAMSMGSVDVIAIRGIHETLLELYEREPHPTGDRQSLEDLAHASEIPR
jgi:hypothetical protein